MNPDKHYPDQQSTGSVNPDESVQDKNQDGAMPDAPAAEPSEDVQKGLEQPHYTPGSQEAAEQDEELDPPRP